MGGRTEFSRVPLPKPTIGGRVMEVWGTGDWEGGRAKEDKGCRDSRSNREKRRQLHIEEGMRGRDKQEGYGDTGVVQEKQEGESLKVRGPRWKGSLGKEEREEGQMEQAKRLRGAGERTGRRGWRRQDAAVWALGEGRPAPQDSCGLSCGL